ncbi:138_t:CDS:1 [Acaulospora morrowiae]|uniref:138_t:CDS:1 n=1 Tax=Acaulospora morrowiae TaxID=94023 RepID=A0A9N9FS72_9GLOM|nr:138_t:CDS:1 [Acaulospora morrowiae]
MSLPNQNSILKPPKERDIISSNPQSPITPKRHVRRKSFYPSTFSFLLGHFSSLLQYLIRQTFRSNNLPFILTFLWHSFHIRRLIFFPRAFLKKYTASERQLLPAVAVDLIRRIGSLNISLALLALLALVRFRDLSAQKVALLVLTVANGSQTWNDVSTWSSGRWSWTHLIENGGGNGLITLVNFIAYILSVAKSGSL